MNCYDEQLRQLQAQCARKKKLEAVAAELRIQQDTYTARVQELKQAMLEEQADVDRLEGRSLAAFFYHFTGKIEEKLSKEELEAYAARIKYDAAVRELDAAEEDLRRCEAELHTLEDCEKRYTAVMQEKMRAVKAAGGQTAEKILQLETRAIYLEEQEKQLQEAIAAGRAALTCADQVLSRLDSAENWGTWDLFGGGLLADFAKHDHLDQAQASVESLQSQLRHFRTELADVTIEANFQVSIDGFLRVADYVFDNFFTDWAVLDRIHQSQTQIQNTKNQIEGVLDHLHVLLRQADAEKSEIQNEIDRLVSSVPM